MSIEELRRRLDGAKKLTRDAVAHEANLNQQLWEAERDALTNTTPPKD